MLRRGLNTPLTSSAGRLFDAAAALIGLRQRSRFEGQAAMELEFAIGATSTDVTYPFQLVDRQAPAVVDWGPTIHALLDDVGRAVAASRIAARLHNTLVEMMVAAARHVGEVRVVLSGGCFQNPLLAEGLVSRLSPPFDVYLNRRVPPGDGGIALGQAAVAAAILKGR